MLKNHHFSASAWWQRGNAEQQCDKENYPLRCVRRQSSGNTKIESRHLATVWMCQAVLHYWKLPKNHILSWDWKIKETKMLRECNKLQYEGIEIELSRYSNYYFKYLYISFEFFLFATYWNIYQLTYIFYLQFWNKVFLKNGIMT